MSNEILLPDDTIHELTCKIAQQIDSYYQDFTVSKDWIPWAACMTFLSYGNTQMVNLEKSKKIIVSKIGKRKFVQRKSLDELLKAGICT